MTIFDVIVVGRGMMGAAAARHLALAGKRVALIGTGEPAEKANNHGVFASHYDEGRITRAIDTDPDWSLLSRRSIARYREIEKTARTRFFDECGAIMAGPETAGEQPFVHHALDVARHAGIVHECYRGQALGDRFPYFRFPEGTLAIYEPDGAGRVNPRALVAAQSAIACRLGAVSVDDEVVSLQEKQTEVAAVCASGSELSGRRVIVAAGAFSNRPRFLPSPLLLQVFARTNAFIEVDEVEAKRLADMPSLVLALPDTSSVPYLLPPIRYLDGKLYLKIGGDPENVELATIDDIKAWFQSGGDPDVHAYLMDIIKDLMPDLRMTKVSSGACVTAFTPNGKPIIAHQSECIIALTGGNGAGAKCSDELGRLGARLAFGESLSDEPYLTDFSGIA